jgi:histidinol phosphatase-like PHP family hydrolase
VSVATGGLLGTQDLHCHTEMSDGHLSLSEVVAVAASRGVQVGIADHVSTRNPGMMISTPAEAERYLAALETAPVFRSAEFCWCDTLWRELPDELMARLDYRIGSNHGFWLPDGSVASPWWESLPPAWRGREDDLVEIMVANLCDMVATMPIEIAAHSTLLPPAVLRVDPDPERWWTEAREDRYVAALHSSGVALEISNRYRLPHDRLLARALAAGVRFSLGSDGHRERQVAALDWAAETARRVGIDEGALFVPERCLGGA